MMDAQADTNDGETDLKCHLSREYVSRVGKRGMTIAAGFALLGVMGLMLPLAYPTQIEWTGFVQAWPGIWFSLAALAAIWGYGRIDKARYGPDQWLSIGPGGVAFVSLGFFFRSRKFVWSHIWKWGLIDLPDYRGIWFLQNGERVHFIDPLIFVWSRDATFDSNALAAGSLSRSVELLFRRYAGDRQGRTRL